MDNQSIEDQEVIEQPTDDQPTGAIKTAKLSRNLAILFLLFSCLGPNLLSRFGAVGEFSLIIILFFIFVASFVSGVVALKKMASNEKKKVLFPAITGMALSSIFMLSISVIFITNFIGAKNDTVQRGLVAMVAEQKMNLPRIVDDEIRVDDIYLLEGKYLHYEYTLLTTTVEELDLEDLNAFESLIEEGMQSNTDLKPLLETLSQIEGNVTFTYRDNNGELISSTTVP